MLLTCRIYLNHTTAILTVLRVNFWFCHFRGRCRFNLLDNIGGSGVGIVLQRSGGLLKQNLDKDFLNNLGLHLNFFNYFNVTFLYGHHTALAYSKCGLTIALYSKVKVCTYTYTHARQKNCHSGSLVCPAIQLLVFECR